MSRRTIFWLVVLAGVYWIDRRRHASDETLAAIAEPEMTAPN